MKRATATLLMILTAAAMTSCQSEEERKDEELREELRNFIAVIEKAQKEHIEAEKENVKIKEKHNSKKISVHIPTNYERATRKLEKVEADHTNGWQKEIRRRLDEAEGEELKGIGREMNVMWQKADFGKKSAEMAVRDMERRMATPREQRWP